MHRVFRHAARALCFVAALTAALLVPPTAAQQPAWSPNDDPVARSVNEAIHDQRYTDAEKILLQAIPAAEQSPSGPQLSFYRRSLAALLQLKGDSTGALAQAQLALENQRKLYGSADIRVAGDLSNVGFYLQSLQRPQDAEPLFRQAAEIARQNPNVSGVEPETRVSPLASLGSFYDQEGRVNEAVAVYEEALRLCPVGRVSPQCNTLRGALAGLYRRQGRIVDAEQMPGGPRPAELVRLERQAQDALRGRFFVQAEIHYRSAIDWIVQNPAARAETSLSREWAGLGRALEEQGRMNLAEEAYRKSLDLYESRINPRFPQFAYGFPLSLADLYRKQNRFSEAEDVFRHVLEVQEKILGPDSAHVAETLVQLAQLYAVEGQTAPAKYLDAVAVYERVLQIQEKNFGPDSQGLTRALVGYAGALRALHRDAEAAQVQARVDALRNRR
jgi:tetratricopeptide (TPR) repeat protein